MNVKVVGWIVAGLLAMLVFSIGYHIGRSRKPFIVCVDGAEVTLNAERVYGCWTCDPRAECLFGLRPEVQR